MEKEKFNDLLKQESENSVSIYIPTHRSGKEVNEKQDSIRFKNVLQAVTSELYKKGLGKSNVDALLSPAFLPLRDEEFWNNLDQGLAVFIAKDFFEIYKLPFSVPEEFYVHAGFHLTPLVPLFMDRPYFYLLMISKNSSSLFKGNTLGIDKIEIEGLPQGVNDVIHFEEKSERKLFRGSGTAPGKEGSLHGHGSGLEDEKEYISQYLKEVDQTLMTELLANENAPLLVAGVEYIGGIYKQVSHYKHIINTILTGNYEHTSLGQLFEKALRIALPNLEEPSKKALKNYYDQLTTSLTSSMPEKVIPAAFYKQVYDLFVEKDLHIWGTFNEAENRLVINQQKNLEDLCLVNKAMVKTIANGGAVYILEKERMPNGAEIAASLRF